MSATTTNDAEVMSPPKRIGWRSNGMLLAPVEFDQVRSWQRGYRYELVNGVLIVVPPAGTGERSPNDELGYILNLHKRTHPQGKLIDETLPEQTIVTGDNRRVADRAIWIGLGRLPDPDVDVPTIAIEFVSKSRRDRRRDYEIKRQEYLTAGVKEYWVIDRFRRQFSAFCATGKALVLAPDQEYQTSLLPGFLLRLSEVFAAADRYGRRPPTPDQRK